MITEDYVSYEVAKLLKEKGFDEFCLTSYNTFLSNHKVEESKVSGWGKANQIYRPTHQMAMKWLRETRDIVISIFPTIETDMIVREDYNYAIYKNKTVVYQSCSTSYEEACEAAIRCCLENLI